MALTDPKLFYFLIVLSILTFASIVYFWKRLSGSKFASLVSRILSLLILNILIVMTLGVGLNNYGQFYASWGELLGARNTSPLLVDTILTEIDSSELAKAKFTSNGSAIVHRLVRGESAGITGDFFIALPPSFVSSVKSGTKPRTDYPVIEFLSGYPGHPSAWVKGMDMVDRLDKAHLDGKLPEVISVYPNINLVPKFDAECMNIPGGPQMESWLVQDVPKYVNQWLGLAPQPWTVVGYSTGGWCSAMLSLRHPLQFRAAGSIAGYYSPLVDKQITASIKKELTQEYSLDTILAGQPPAINLFVLNSVNDTFSHSATLAFLRRVKAPISVTEVELSGVGHNFNAWKKILPSMIDWYSKVLAKPVP